MTRTDYEVLAEAFKALRWHNRHEVIDGLMLWMKENNPQFDETRFAKASQHRALYSRAPWRASK